MSWGGVIGEFGTTYRVTIYTLYDAIKLKPNKEKYEEIVDHLWRALAVPIITKVLQQLQKGRSTNIWEH